MSLLSFNFFLSGPFRALIFSHYRPRVLRLLKPTSFPPPFFHPSFIDTQFALSFSTLSLSPLLLNVPFYSTEIQPTTVELGKLYCRQWSASDVDYLLKVLTVWLLSSKLAHLIKSHCATCAIVNFSSVHCVPIGSREGQTTTTFCPLQLKVLPSVVGNSRKRQRTTFDFILHLFPIWPCRDHFYRLVAISSLQLSMCNNLFFNESFYYDNFLLNHQHLLWTSTERL